MPALEKWVENNGRFLGTIGRKVQRKGPKSAKKRILCALQSFALPFSKAFSVIAYLLFQCRHFRTYNEKLKRDFGQLEILIVERDVETL